VIPEIEAIKRILRFDWDPIGVGDSAADEYGGYAMHLFTALSRGAGAADVCAYLERTELEHMGLFSQLSGVTAQVAKKVMEAHCNKGRLQ
jgi:hypothetical protein